jgi:signal transduction histidine kinase
VNGLSPSDGSNGVTLPNPAANGVAAQLRALADLSASFCAGAACLIAWQGLGKAMIIRAATDLRSRSLLDSLFAAVQRDPRYERRSTGWLRFGHRDLAAACGPRPHTITAAASVSCAVGGETRAISPEASTHFSSAETLTRATVILTAPRASYSHDLAVAAELAATAAIAIIGASAAHASRDFWRTRTSETAERLGRLQSESSLASSERSRIDRAAAAAAKLRSRNRFARLASHFAKLGPFDAWIVATIDGEILRVYAVSGVLAPTPLDGQRSHTSALTECFMRQTTIVRTTQTATRMVYDEDRIFAPFDTYVCVPFEHGAIALAAHTAPDSSTIARIEALAVRLNPLIAKWLLEDENDRLRRLVRNLGLRMFSAIDLERARIARDLHDHQAQLLAAARIGIEAGPDEARGIFKQLEDALRLRVRELKPLTLGRSTLAEALRYELGRLADAGIKGRLTHADEMNALTRPVQQVCYQVAREALANVIRHAGASRVEITIEKHGERVRLSILDNGKGIGNAIGRGGIGLNGLSERLELMGGRLLVESKAGSTRLVAEIPEPA